MKRHIILLFVLLSATCHIYAQNGYKIQVKWEGLSDTTIFLARYYDTHILVQDTTLLNKKGEAIFQNKEDLKEGLYLLYLNENSYVDFLVGKDQTFDIGTHNSDLRGKLSIKGAVESEKFLEYQKFLVQMNSQKGTLQQQLSENKNDNEQISKQMSELDKQMTTFIEKESQALPGSMYTVFINAVAPFPNAEIPVTKDHPKYDSIAWHTNYEHRTNNFLSGIDFTDSRILSTPLFKPKIDAYFNQVLLQMPDTIIKHGIRLIEKSKPNPTMFQYMSQYVLNWGLQSKIMGMDAVFVAAADHVYLKGQATWADSTMLAKINEEAFFLRNNLVGKKAAPLRMLDIDDQPFNLNDLNADYFILSFWEPNCGHCKKEIPALYNDIYLKHINKNIEVIAIFTGADIEEWKQFIDKNELVGWHHIYDPTHQSRYRINYNIRSTPQLFLLDKDKKIIAKRLDHETLGKLLENLSREK